MSSARSEGSPRAPLGSSQDGAGGHGCAARRPSRMRGPPRRLAALAAGICAAVAGSLFAFSFPASTATSSFLRVRSAVRCTFCSVQVSECKRISQTAHQLLWDQATRASTKQCRVMALQSHCSDTARSQALNKRNLTRTGRIRSGGKTSVLSFWHVPLAGQTTSW